MKITISITLVQGALTTQTIVFLDIDGTLAGIDGQVPASALTACREARRRGHLLYICSGRPKAHISAAILAIGFDGVISSGGAHIETGSTSADSPYHGQVIFDAVMPAALVREIAAYLDEKRCSFLLEQTNVTYPSPALISHWEAEAGRLEGETKRKFVERITAFRRNPLPDNLDASHYENINKLIFVDNGTIFFSEFQRAFKGRCEIFHGSVPYAGKEGGEVCPLGVHKGSAVEKIAKYHGIAIANTIAFGDSDNDREMVKRAGIGIAMGNADDALKAIADDITTALNDNGIFNGFRKLKLI